MNPWGLERLVVMAGNAIIGLIAACAATNYFTTFILGPIWRWLQ